VVLQHTPTSSYDPQSVIPHPLKGQSPTLASLPAQLSWSIQIRPDPSPYTASPSWVSIAMPPNRPSWRQTTAASALPKPSSQTVPQRLLWSTSTRPQLGLSPLTIRIFDVITEYARIPACPLSADKGKTLATQ